MTDWTVIGRQGLRAALETRRRVGAAKDDPICIYNVAERLGVEVLFCGGKSFGGMYAKDSQTVLVPAQRPAGRQAFTCGHELGHWYFGHGTRVDEIDDLDRERDDDPDELLAHTFAGHLLMPVWAVKAAFARRKLQPLTCSPLQFYAVALQLGVGYETLVQHARHRLELISTQRAEDLLRSSPKQIRQEILGGDHCPHLVVASTAWQLVPIDLQVGDQAILPAGITLDGASVASIGSHTFGQIVEARTPGITRVEVGGWAAFVRVCRRRFEGRSIYRFLEESDDDKSA